MDMRKDVRKPLGSAGGRGTLRRLTRLIYADWLPQTNGVVGGLPLSRDSAAPLGQFATAGVIATVVPGCFLQHTSEVAVARLGDPALTAFGAAGVLPGDQAQAGHELPCGGEATGVADVGVERQGDQGLDA